MKKLLVISIAVSVANLWFFTLFAHNIFLTILLTLESILLVLSFMKVKKASFLALILLVLLSLYTLREFDKSIFFISNLDVDKGKQRQIFYGTELGKLYRNRLGLFYFNNVQVYSSRINNKFFQNLEFEQYLKRYSIFAALLFFVGLLYLLVNKSYVSLIYLVITLVISSLIHINTILGPYLLFPFFNLCMALGLIYLANFLYLHISKRKSTKK